MACPFFLPMEKIENAAWLHALRLPLGGGWSGQCTSPGFENEIPSPDDLRNFCNLGYAETCGRLPKVRAWDSVRFSAKVVNYPQSGTVQRIQIQYVCERAHYPVTHGRIEFDFAESNWVDRHPDPRLQRMAECFLESYLEKQMHEKQTHRRGTIAAS